MPIINVKGHGEMELPDGLSKDEMLSIIRMRTGTVNAQSSDQDKQQTDKFNPWRPVDEFKGRNVIDDARDIAGGAADALQNVGSTLLEGGEYITRKGAEKLGRDLGHPINVPKWNAREFAGLEGDNQIHLGDYLRSANPDSTATAIGEMLPNLMIGGGGLATSAIKQGLAEALKSAPDERLKNASLATGGIYGIGKGLPYLPKILGAVKGVGKGLIDYLRPGAAVEDKLREITSTAAGDALPTAGENIEDFSRRAQLGRKSAEKEALIPKNILYGEKGEEDLYNINPENLPENNMQRFGALINKGEKSNPKQLQALSNSLTEFRKTGDTDAFIENAEDIFGLEELSPKQIKDVEEVLEMQTSRRSRYLEDEDVTEPYNKKGALLKAHEEFESSPTLNNYFDLQSKLKKEIRSLRSKAPTDTSDQKLTLLQDNLDRLEKDHADYTDLLEDRLQDFHKDFSKKWAVNVAKYDNLGSSKIAKALVDSGGEGVTQEQFQKIFTGKLTPELERILDDVGPSGFNNILYNKLVTADPKNVKQFAQTIIDARRSGGYERFISKDLEKFARDLITRKNVQSTVFGTAAGVPIAYGAYKGGKSLYDNLFGNGGSK